MDALDGEMNLLCVHTRFPRPMFSFLEERQAGNILEQTITTTFMIMVMSM